MLSYTFFSYILKVQKNPLPEKLNMRQWLKLDELYVFF